MEASEENLMPCGKEDDAESLSTLAFGMAGPKHRFFRSGSLKSIFNVHPVEA